MFSFTGDIGGFYVYLDKKMTGMTVNAVSFGMIISIKGKVTKNCKNDWKEYVHVKVIEL